MSPAARLRADLLATGATLAVLLVVVLRGDRIPANGGLGYDGVRYAAIARDFTLDRLSGLQPYMFQRILPPAIVHASLRVLGVPRTDRNIIRAFLVLDIAAIVLGVLLWCRAASALELSNRARFLGFAALSLAHANLRIAPFNPVMTDSAAFLVGCAMLYCHLTRRWLGLAVVTLAGAFTWPVAMYAGGLLLVFPREEEEKRDPGGAPRRALAAALSASILALAFIGWILASDRAPVGIYERHIRPLVPLSSALTALYLFFALRPLLDDGSAWACLRPGRVLRSGRFWLVATGVLALRAIFSLVPRAADSRNFSTLSHFRRIFYQSVVQPGVSIVGHTLYYGPFLLFLVFQWKPVIGSIRRQGPGFVWVMALTVLLAVGSNSRQLIFLYPFVVFALVHATERMSWGRIRTMSIAVLCVVFSKVWLPMDRDLVLPFFDDVAWRTLFMSSQGHWLNHRLYAIEAAGVVGVAFLLFFSYVRGARSK
ncbi:MAG: hypothetical protein HY720_11940 [Planctomycetes bacterium]|nr:hypothetical protein [Planctomycetota bacterium]